MRLPSVAEPQRICTRFWPRFKTRNSGLWFWTEFGRVLKEGMIEDTANRETIAKLLRFASTASTDATQDVSLEGYVARMKEGQDKIYYMIADSYAAAANSFEQAVVLLPHDAINHTNFGISLAGIGDYKRAVDEARRAHELAPENPEIQRFLDALPVTGAEQRIRCKRGRR